MSLTDKLSLDWSVNHTYPLEHREIIEQYIREWQWMLPYWVRRIHLMHSETAAPLTVQIEYRYRQLVIHIGDDFFTCSKKCQSEYILHELCHAHTTNHINVARRIAKCGMSEESYKIYDNEIDHDMEHATESLAEIFWKMHIDKPKK